MPQSADATQGGEAAATARGARMTKPKLAVYALAALTLAACGGSPNAQTAKDAAALAALQSRIAALEHRKTLVADSIEVERLQAAFGYYFDKALWDDIGNLFADDGTIEIALDGVYVGKARVREYLKAVGGGREGPREGHLDEHLQVMPVVTLAADGLTAKARWRGIVLQGDYGGDAHWGEGPYENEYVKQNGVWKIKTLHWYQSLFVPYAGGWQTNPDPTMGKLASGITPDRPPSVDYKTWPETYLPPFSFPNPVAKYVPPAGESGGAQ